MTLAADVERRPSPDLPKCSKRKRTYILTELEDLNAMEADRALLIRRSGGVIPNLYYCPDCSGHHLGYDKRKRKLFTRKGVENYNASHGSGGRYPLRAGGTLSPTAVNLGERSVDYQGMGYHDLRELAAVIHTLLSGDLDPEVRRHLGYHYSQIGKRISKKRKKRKEERVYND